MEILEGTTWTRRFKSCTMQVQPGDARGALAVAQKFRAFLGDCDFNIDQPDRFHSALGRGLDMVGEFNRPRYSVSGKVWLETKCFTEADFDDKMQKARDQVELDHAKVLGRGGGFGAAMLLVAKLARTSSVEWGTPKLFAELYADGRWQDIGPLSGRQPMAGRLLASKKPTLAAVWRKMGQAVLADSGEEVGFLTHFLKEVDSKNLGNPGKIATTYNRILQKAGVADRIKQKKIDNHPGQWPYVASKKAFEIVLKHF